MNLKMVGWLLRNYSLTIIKLIQLLPINLLFIYVYYINNSLNMYRKRQLKKKQDEVKKLENKKCMINLLLSNKYLKTTK